MYPVRTHSSILSLRTTFACILVALEGGMRRPPSSPLAEKLGGLNLPKGGANGYIGVRKVRKGKYQGYTPKKKHTTAAYDKPEEAAAALAAKKQDILLDLVDDVERKPRAAKGACNMRMRARPTARPRHLI